MAKLPLTHHCLAFRAAKLCSLDFPPKCGECILLLRPPLVLDELSADQNNNIS